MAAIPTQPRDITPLGGVAYFVGGDRAHGEELWKTDGTVGGTGLVKDIRPGAEGSNLGLYRGATAAVGATLFFIADDGVHGTELWKTDGTGVGTVLVKDIAPGMTSTYDWDGNPTEEPASSYPSWLVSFRGAVYFTAGDGQGATRLWTSNGTEGGTQPIGAAGSSVTGLAVAGDMLLVSRSDDQGTEGVWKLDASGTGLEPLASGTSASFYDNNVAEIDGRFFFAGDSYDDATGALVGALWVTDGTSDGTRRIEKEFVQAPGSLTAVGGTLFFTADDGEAGNELWKSDGTATGTVLVKDIATGTQQQESWDQETFEPILITVPRSSYPMSLKAVGDALLFGADDGQNGVELWKSDGTAEGTQLVKDLAPGSKKVGGVTVPNSSVPRNFTDYNGSTYLQTSNGSLWKTDGSAAGTTVVKSMPGTNSGSGSFGSMAVLNGKLFFAASDGKGGEDLWASDGTPAGTAQPKNVPATVTSVDLPADGTLGAGQSLVFTVHYDGPVTVVGKPSIGVTVGNKVRKAVYSSGSGTSGLVFALKVTKGDTDADGVTVAGKISGTVRNAFASKVKAMAALPSLATAGIRVDTVPPGVLSVVVPANNTYTAGDTLSFQVTFSEPVTVAGTPQIAVTIGKTVRQAVYVSGSDSATLLFQLEVQQGDAAPKGIRLAKSIGLNGGGIADATGNRATLTLKKVNTSLVKVG